MRELKDLLLLLILFLKKEKTASICTAIINMDRHALISGKESILLSKFIKENKPKGKNIEHFWWKPYNKGYRLKFLNNLVKKCES